MSKLLLALSLVCISIGSHAQHANDIISRLYKSQSEMKSVSYSLLRIDSLVTGHTRKITGSAIVDFEHNNFLINRDDTRLRLWQAGGRLLVIDDAGSQYTVGDTIPTSIIYQKPGGQIYVDDFVHLDTSHATQITVTDEGRYKRMIIKRTDITEHNVYNRYKELLIDTMLYLPVDIRLHQETAGKVQDIHFTISSVKINDQKSVDSIKVSGVPAWYGYKTTNHPDSRISDMNGRLAPDFTLVDWNNKTVSLQSLRGKIVLLDFWEVWCGPCIASMPKLNELHRKYAKHGVVIAGVLLRGAQKEQALRMPVVQELEYLQLIGTDDVKKTFMIEQIPRYVLIDRNGKVVLGDGGDVGILEESIKALL